MSVFARLSLANRSLIALAALAVVVVGALVIPSLKQELYPSLAYPAISVIASYPGASPELVEQDVTNPLEQNIEGLQGIQSLTSSSNESSAIIVAEYDFGTDLDKAKQDLSDRVTKTQASLPSTASVQVQSYNISDMPVMQLAVTSSADQQTLALALKQQVVPALSGITGVADVSLTGVRDQIVTMTLDIKKLQDKGLSMNQVQTALQANNMTLPAGELTGHGQVLSIRVGNTLNSLQEMKDLVVGNQVQTTTSSLSQSGSGLSLGSQLSGSQLSSQLASSLSQTKVQTTPVKLSDVATVEQTLAPSTTLTRTNGAPSLGLAITKDTSGNTVALSQAVKAQIPKLEKELGSDAKITIISDQAPSIQSSITGLESEGLIGAFFAVIVILFFLFSIRSTLVAAISIPLSIIIALIGLWVGNYSLNLFTLGGLTIAVGRVIDDSIVVLENIFRHLGRGENKRKAVMTAVSEVAGAITASTLTTVAVFLPIAFTGGIAGELFKPFSITVTIALVASLCVALTIVPVLAYWFLRVPKPGTLQTMEEEKPNRLERAYIPLLRWVTTHRAITLVSATLLFFASLLLTPLLGTNLFDSTQQNTFSISQQLAPETDMNTTEQAAIRIEEILKTVPDVQMYQVTIGSSNSFLRSSGGANIANFSVTTRDGADQSVIQQTVRERLNTLNNAGTITLSTASSGGFNSSSTSVIVQAADEQTLKSAAQMVYDAVRKIPNTSDVSSSAADAVPLIDVRVDPTKALKYNLTASQVGMLVREIYTGTTITTITLNNTQENVNMQLGTPADTVQGMQSLLLPISNGTVTLGDVADVTQIEGPIQITHTNGARTATISTTISASNVGRVTSQIQRALAALNLPGGATYSMGGVSSNQSQTFQDLELAILVAVLLVYLVMVATFRSIVQPLILLVAIPFAVTGSILLLFLTHTSLGAPALIGLLMLVGIVVTNAIILLDLIRQYRRKGFEPAAAVLEGGRRRLRPILMTAIATILALLPMALGLDKSSVFIAGPLAIVVIGGLTSSTILTLLLVPTLYLTVENWRGTGNTPEVDDDFNLKEEPQLPRRQLASPLS
jgi:hydrophobic/amphiphilic exporter-1 (mainly G- bacteria), HAE1 family